MSTPQPQLPTNEKSVADLLNQISQKIDKPKKGFWDIAPVVLTLLSTIGIGVISVMVNKQNSTEQRKLDKDSKEKETILRKTQILGEFKEYLSTNDSIKNKIAIVGIYTMDTSLSLKLARILNTVGTNSAIESLFNNATDSMTREQIGKVLAESNVSLETNPNEANFIDEAIAKALKEFDNGAREDNTNTNSGEYVTKYMAAVRSIPEKDKDWAGPFVAWCYLSIPELKGQLKMMETDNIPTMLENFEKNGFITASNNNIKKGDIVFFSLKKASTVDHCGLVYKYDNNLVYTVEGNYKIDNAPDGVVCRVRKLSSIVKTARLPFNKIIKINSVKSQ